MHHLRDSLLSSLPKDLSDSVIMANEESVKEDIARGELKQLRGSAFYNRSWIVTTRYCDLGDGVDSLEKYIHSLWYIYYELARNTSHESTDHDRLVLDIIRIQGKGALTRPVAGNYGIDIARTVEGTLWNDLPFLATDMTNFWVKNCASMSLTHRTNFACFLAKLASTRVSKDRLCQIALFTLRVTFEEGRDLRTTEPEEPEKEDPNRKLVDLDLVHLLPAALAWIKESDDVLIQLSDLYWNDCPSDISRGGRNFVQSEFGKRSPTGFTPWRYMYWLKRVHEICDEAKEAGDGPLEEYATDAIEYMTSKLEERNSEILRAYRDGGDFLQQEKYLVCLKRILNKEPPEMDEEDEEEGGEAQEADGQKDDN